MYYLESLGASLREVLIRRFGMDAGPVSWEPPPPNQLPGGKGRVRDFSSHYAFHAAKRFLLSPLEIAQAFTEAWPEELGVSIQTIAPGFLNFSLQPQGACRILSAVRSNPSGYGKWTQEEPRRINVEFCSANPTGPIHLGNARGACLGFAISNLLEASGHSVCREYYFDDCGTQVDTFAHSLAARYREALGRPGEFPADGYQGAYVTEIGRKAAHEHPEWLDLTEEALRLELRRFGLEAMGTAHRRTMEKLGIRFDTWFSQSSLDLEGYMRRSREMLEKRGVLYAKEGALWFRSSAFGDDKDRVVVRSNGEPTYFAWDIAYNLNKVERRFQRVIDVWGPDHHGYVLRNKAAFQALGFDPEDLTLLIYQLVLWFEQGEEVKMSKRTGEFLTLDEVVEAVGKDAVFFFLLDRSPDSTLNFDLDLAKQQSLENPVYYVQYAYTRAFSVLREAEARGLKPCAPSLETCQAYGPAEYRLLAKIALAPEEIAAGAVSLLPHRLTTFTKELAGDFHAYYHDNRVLGVDPLLGQARLNLVAALRDLFGNLLRLLGLEAPEKM
jgi:arginyl-tRNA synthetase